jgi:PleD family two-component response regulator
MTISDLVPVSKKTVMAVDDDHSMVAFIGMLMKQQGHKFVGLHSGRDCLAQIDEVRPNILILDVNMPDMDGFETCKKFRAEHADIAIPVLFLTGNDSEFGLSSAISAGGTEYLAKPIDADALATRVNYWLSLL